MKAIIMTLAAYFATLIGLIIVLVVVTIVAAASGKLRIATDREIEESSEDIADQFCEFFPDSNAIRILLLPIVIDMILLFAIHDVCDMIAE